MQKKILLSYFIIFAVLLAFMSFSRQTSDKIRSYSVELAAPLWENILSLKYFFFNPTKPSPFNHFTIEEENQKLLLNNQLLENEISYLQKSLQEKLAVSSKINQLSSIFSQETNRWEERYQKSFQSLLQTLPKRIEGVPARIIFRSLDHWNTFLWINVGQVTNQIYPHPIISYHSPVVMGNAIVGIIDYVGKNQSRVRLITDSWLTPSVRALRGAEQDYSLGDQIDLLLQNLNQKKALSLHDGEKTHLIHLLTKLKDNLIPFKKTWYLAKGELIGSTLSPKRGQEAILKGTGFNYDFADEEGGGRDLRSGKLTTNNEEQAVPILKVNDLLVTTGMDGVFPPGFHAAIVTKVGLLKEGDYFYSLEARAVAEPLNELSLVFVLPPISQESFDVNESSIAGHSL